MIKCYFCRRRTDVDAYSVNLLTDAVEPFIANRLLCPSCVTLYYEPKRRMPRTLTVTPEDLINLRPCAGWTRRRIRDLFGEEPEMHLQDLSVHEGVSFRDRSWAIVRLVLPQAVILYLLEKGSFKRYLEELKFIVDGNGVEQTRVDEIIRDEEDLQRLLQLHYEVPRRISKFLALHGSKL